MKTIISSAVSPQKYFRIAVFVLFLVSGRQITLSQNSNSVHSNDTLSILSTGKIPSVDGIENDACWKSVEWQPIDQAWIPYGDSVSSRDFSGSYKIVWSPKTSLLYFIVKITDDEFVDGYRYDSDPKKGDFYYNFDLLEVFVDEDRSGGMHVFDSDRNLAKEWGSNSANAFSYHMILDAPKDGGMSRQFTACDLGGKSWDNYFIANYADHFNDFTLRRNGNEYVWEFSIKVYSDRYDPKKKEDSRARLFPGKIMGISLAYCDNDDRNEVPKERDNFFGSVWVPKESNNDHWKNADGYRVVRLK
ncbi:MAG: sugar-binding protein [Bacteroidota bacterium]